jgi:cysteine desulfurase
LHAGIVSELEEVILNGCAEQRYAGNLNLSISFVEGESLIMGLKNVCVSSGSACTSASLEPSYVLRGIGVSEDLAHTSIRFGIGRFTTDEEIDFTIRETVHHIQRLRDMSPLYDLWKDGVLGQIVWTHH